MSKLQRLIITFKSEEMIVHALYRTQDAAKLGPNTKGRRREVTELTREGLSAALEALEGDVEMVGVSGYQVREDVLDVALPRPYEARDAERAS
jgi:hypothetical protein